MNNSRTNLDIESLEKKFALSSFWSISPKIHALTNLNIKEDISSPVYLKLTDRDSQTLNVQISVSSGRLSVGNQPNTFVTTSGTPELGFSLNARGNKANLNLLFNSLKYEPLKDSNNQESLIIKANDGKNQSVFKSQINIRPINDAPIFSGNDVVYLNKQVLKQNIQVKDPDSKIITVSIGTDNGSIEILDSSVSVKNLGNKTKLVGNISKINQIFSSDKIKLSPVNGEDFKLTLSVSDGKLSSNKIITVSQKESVIDNATNAILSRLNDKDPSIAKSIFSVQDHENGIYVRNPNVWTQNLDLTSISPWNSSGGRYLAGTLVSPRHIVFATHYQMSIGAKVRFVTRDNVVVERTLVNKVSPPYTGMYFPDITVGVLDQDVPSSIGFAKILPANWENYIDNAKINIYNGGTKIPCLALDQEEKALVTGLYNLNATGYALFNWFTEDPYNKFYENIIAGDSGNPSFLIIDNQLVLVTIWTFGGGGSGTFITAQKDSINQIMKQLGGDYQLTEMDLSKFAKIS